MYKLGDKVLVRNSGENPPLQGTIIGIIDEDNFKVHIDGTSIVFDCPAEMLSSYE